MAKTPAAQSVCDPFPSELMQLLRKLAANHTKQGKLLKSFQEAFPSVASHTKNVSDLENVKTSFSADFSDLVYSSKTTQLALAMNTVKAVKRSIEATLKVKEKLMAQETSMIAQVLASVCKEPGNSVQAEEDVKENETDGSSEGEDEAGDEEQVSAGCKRRMKGEVGKAPGDEKK